ncbi:MAG: EamA family transporter, partial [Actinobacteria bacterium]
MLTAVVLFASAFVAIRGLATSDAFTANQIVLMRMLVASACLGVIAPANRGVAAPRGKDWFAFLALGAAGQTAYQMLLTHGERSV